MRPAGGRLPGIAASAPGRRPIAWRAVHAPASHRDRRAAARIARSALLALPVLVAACSGGGPEELAPADALIASYRERFPMPEGPWAGIGDATAVRAGLAQTEREFLTREIREPTAKIHRDLGALYTMVEEHARGMAWLLRALDDNPGHPEVWLWMGGNRLSVDEVDDAIVLLERADELDTAQTRTQRREANPRIARYLGEAWFRKGDDARAREAYERALRTQPNYVEVLPLLARLLVETGDLDAAEPRIEQMLALDPNSPTALWLEVRVLEARGDLEGAEEFRARHARATLLDDLGQRTSGLPIAGQTVNLGIHYLQIDETEKALEEFRRGLLELASAPAQTDLERLGNAEIEAEAHARMTVALLRLGRLDEARRSLAKLGAMTDDLGEPHRMLDGLREELRQAEGR